MCSVTLSRGIKKIVFLIYLVMFGIAPAHAANCVIDQLPNKSQGITVKQNDCELPALGVGALLEIKPSGRLWVRAASRGQEENSFEVICQNRHSQAVQMSVASMISPWLAAVEMSACNNWAGGRLVCDQGGQKGALVCAIAAISRTVATPSDEMGERTTSAADAGMMESTTSVKMRSVGLLGRAGKQTPTEQELVALLQPLQQQAGLCRQLFQAQQPLNVEWIIDIDGSAQDIVLQNTLTAKDRDFAECVISAIKDFTYPVLPRPTTLTQRF